MTLVVKSRLPTSDDVRRFCLKLDTSFNALQGVLHQIYPKLPNFTVKYQLTDSDIREINTDEDFRAAVAYANGSKPPILRLIVCEAPVKNERDIMESSWIFVPNEQKATGSTEPQLQNSPPERSSSKGLLSSLPSIFGFQLPSFTSPAASPSSSFSSTASSASLSTSSSLESKILSQLPPMDLPQLRRSDPMDLEIPMELSSTEEPPVIALETPGEVTITQPMRLADLCVKLSEETSRNCIASSKNTLEDSSMYSRSISGLCSESSATTKTLCHRESDSILSQLGSSPSSKVIFPSFLADATSSECAKLSQETSRMCSVLSKNTATSARSEETAVLNNCADLSKSTAEECRALSRGIVSQILAL